MAAQTLSRLEATLDRSLALGNAGQFAEALALAQRVAGEGKVLGYVPFYTSALYQVALVNYQLGEYQESEAAVAVLVKVASIAGDDKRVADAWLLRQTVAITQANYEEAMRLEPWVDAVVLRSGDQPMHRAKLLTALATVHLRQGRHQDAEQQYRKGLEILESEAEQDLAAIAKVQLNLGIVALTQGKHDLANEHLARSLEMQEQVLGRNHPDLGRVR